MKLNKTLSIIFVSLLIALNVQANIINVPDDVETIQDGIDVATDGDTVLVQPGNYVENINFDGKKIVVGSLCLTTGYSFYMSQTVIHGNRSGSVVSFENGEDSTSVLTGFKITRGKAENGGGIYCKSSSPRLLNLTIVDNSAQTGGGIFYESVGNYNSGPNLINVTVKNNSAELGGGFYCTESNLHLANVTIIGNSANKGGGIYCNNSNLIFNEHNRCNIYFNAATTGIDLYADNSPTIAIIVDTFTVMNPNDYHTHPIDNFTFDIFHGKVEQVSADLFVNPMGNINNSGLSEAEPLQTIGSAFARLLADSLNPHTIHLAEGHYGLLLSNGEHFPLNMQSYVSLSGQSRDGVILHAEEKNTVVLNFDHTTGITVENMIITGVGSDRLRSPRSAVFCNHSSPRFMNVIIKGNDGDGFECGNSSPALTDLVLTENGECGIRCISNSNPVLTDVIIRRNSRVGIECHNNSSPTLTNVIICKNSSGFGGGIYCTKQSNPILTNVTITGNSAIYGGGICCENSSPVFNNQNRCNIYFNFAEKGNDLYAINSSIIAVVVDTFTVMNPTNLNAYPIENFIFDINHAKLDQVSADLYVSPAGNNTNSGLSPSDPMQTISLAIKKVLADSLNPHTIYLADGVYSPSTTNENFPLHMIDHVSLAGESQDGVILNAEKKSDIIVFHRIDNVSVSNLTLTGGVWHGVDYNYSTPHFNNVTVKGNKKYGIYCEKSSPVFKDVIIKENGDRGFLCRYSNPQFEDATISNNAGSGIYCHKSSLALANVKINGNNDSGIYLSYSDDLNISDVVVSNNSADRGGAGIYCYFSNPRLVNTVICDNVTVSNGGGIYCYASSPSLSNVTINDNRAVGKGGGIYCEYSLTLNFMNVTITGNTSSSGGGIFCNWPSNLNLINSILWNDSPQEIEVGNSVTIAYSDIQGSKSGIINNNDGTVRWLKGNIDTDPLFADEINYNLNNNSPCIDAGIQDTILLYNNGQDTLFIPPMHYLGTAPDMGAHEFDPTMVVAQNNVALPQHFSLFQNYPNPFNASTVFRYQLSFDSYVELTIYSLTGQKITTLISAGQQAGNHKIEWDGGSSRGGFASGVYFYRLSAHDSKGEGKSVVQTNNLILLK